MPKTWSEEKVQEVVRLWNRGLPITQVAKDASMSRGAVAGMLHRLGYMGDIKPRSKPVAPTKPTPTASNIITKRQMITDEITRVAESNGVLLADMVGRTGLMYVTQARQEAYFELYTKFGLSSERIGQMFDGRDSSTVRFGIREHCARNGIDYEKHRRPMNKNPLPLRRTRMKQANCNIVPVTARDYINAVRM